MNLLLDTHALLWWLDDHPSLSERAREVIADPDNTVYLSAIVIWEIRIKQAIGKLSLPDDFRKVLDEQQFTNLPITLDHAHALEALPLIHRDPFDRMLIVQAHVEGFTIVTHDGSFPSYGVATVTA